MIPEISGTKSQSSGWKKSAGGGEAGCAAPLSPPCLSVQCLKPEKQDPEVAMLCCSGVPSGCPETRPLLTQPTTQWHKLVFSLKTLNSRTSVFNASAVAFHSILMKKKALWWLQQKWHRTLRKLKNFGNWYVRDFLLIIKGYLRGSKEVYNCSIIFDKSVCLKCKWRFFCQSCTQMYFYLLWISRSYLGYGFLRLEDRLTD